MVKGKRTKAVWSDMNDDDDGSSVAEQVMEEARIIESAARGRRDRLEASKAASKTSLSGAGSSPKRIAARAAPQIREDAASELESQGFEAHTEAQVDELLKSLNLSGLGKTSGAAGKSGSSQVMDFDFDDDEAVAGEEFDLDAMVRDDPELQKLMAQLQADSPAMLGKVVDNFKDGTLLANASALQREATSGTEESEAEEEDFDGEEEEEEEDSTIINGYDTSQEENPKKELRHAVQVMCEADRFADPFAHMACTTGHTVAAYKMGLLDRAEMAEPMVPAERTELAQLLDFAEEELSAKGQKSRLMVAEKSALSAQEEVPEDYAGYSWDLVEFGRAPNPDYSPPLEVRRELNIHRAELAFSSMLEQGIKPTAVLLSRLLHVYAAANRREQAMEVLGEFEKYGVQPIVDTYRSLVRMHVLTNDIPGALQVKEEMFAKLGVADSASYGLILESLSHRNLVVDAFKLLEESADRQVVLSEKHLKVLRGRCDSLGVSHPNMPDDPKGWVKDMRVVRHNKRKASRRIINVVRSALS